MFGQLDKGKLAVISAESRGRFCSQGGRHPIRPSKNCVNSASLEMVAIQGIDIGTPRIRGQGQQLCRSLSISVLSDRSVLRRKALNM